MQTSTRNSNLNVNVSRSLTRLESVFVSLIKSLTGTSATPFLRLDTIHIGSKDLNEFVGPMHSEFDSDTQQTNNDGEFEYSTLNRVMIVSRYIGSAAIAKLTTILKMPGESVKCGP